MLVDVTPRPEPGMLGILRLLGDMHGNEPDYVRLSRGVYTAPGGNFDHVLGLRDWDDKYPKLTRRPPPGVDAATLNEWDLVFGPFGVCDNVDQVIAACPELADDCPRRFCVSLTPVRKSHQPEHGGWRWHKWGEYIGTQRLSGCEYLYDEPKIELVYCYHVYEIPSHMVDNTTFATPQIEG